MTGFWLILLALAAGVFAERVFHFGRVRTSLVLVAAVVVTVIISVLPTDVPEAQPGLGWFVGVLLLALLLGAAFESFRPHASFWAWSALMLGIVYFALPLIGMAEFSLSMRRGVYSFDAYARVFADPEFRETFSYSVIMALFTIAFGVLLVVPTAYWVRLKMPNWRPLIEFITLLPLVIPAIVIVFGYIRLYNTSSWLPLTSTVFGTNLLLMFGYSALSLPYMYRAVDTGLRTLDVATLTEAAQSLGASWFTILGKIILPNVLVAVLSGAFVTFAIVLGEFTMAALLDRPAFGPYMQVLGANRAYEPAALAVISFAITWACMGLMQLVTRLQKHTRAARA